MPVTRRPTSAFRMNDWAVCSQCGMWVWANNYFPYGVRPEEVHAVDGDTDPRMHNRALPLEREWACIQRAGGTVPAHFPVPMPYVRRDVDESDSPNRLVVGYGSDPGPESLPPTSTESPSSLSWDVVPASADVAGDDAPAAASPVVGDDAPAPVVRRRPAAAKSSGTVRKKPALARGHDRR